MRAELHAKRITSSSCRDTAAQTSTWRLAKLAISDSTTVGEEDARSRCTPRQESPPSHRPPLSTSRGSPNQILYTDGIPYHDGPYMLEITRHGCTAATRTHGMLPAGTNCGSAGWAAWVCHHYSPAGWVSSHQPCSRTKPDAHARLAPVNGRAGRRCQPARSGRAEARRPTSARRPSCSSAPRGSRARARAGPAAHCATGRRG